MLGHLVGEVAHDYVPALKSWFERQGIRNSYDSWHGKTDNGNDYNFITITLSPVRPAIREMICFRCVIQGCLIYSEKLIPALADKRHLLHTYVLLYFCAYQ